MVGAQYYYRGDGEIGSPDSPLSESVQLTVTRAEREPGSVMLELRSEQFPAGHVTLSAEQVAHLTSVLESYRDPESVTPELTSEERVVHPDGRTDGDTWDQL